MTHGDVGSGRDPPDRAFKDHFSTGSAEYARFRPRYPDGLFAFLASVAPSHGAAWDAATGSGQVAVALAERFSRVIATDASAEQLGNAASHPRVEYRVALSESSGLPTASVALVTVGQALHWFEFGPFYREVRRVSLPGGALAAWTYARFEIGPRVDRTIQRFYAEVVGDHWPPERRHVESGYATIPFPFDRLDAPGFSMSAEWGLEHLQGYIRTWSAVRRYAAIRGHDPVGPWLPELERAWADDGYSGEPVPVRWPLTLLLGRVEAAAR